MAKEKPQIGDLRVWWVPQVPMKSFTVPVKSLVEAKMLLNALADYDLFQFRNKVKPDYSNAGGLSVYWEGCWQDWLNLNGEDIDAYELDELRAMEAKGTLPEWEYFGVPSSA